MTMPAYTFKGLRFAAGIAVVTLFAFGSSVASAEELGAGLSDEDKAQNVTEALSTIKKTLGFTLKRLDLARENKDIIQVNCVNDKLTGIKGFLAIAERSQGSLKEARAQRDSNLLQHEFAKVMLIRDRVENLKLQVEGCVGEISQYTGNSQLTLEVDPDIRTDDPAVTEAVPTFEALNGARPPAVTGSE
ncbi:MAG: hypothetical protein CMH52_00800 [Myxococcales bacterium]|nr:hypothetical protein [Myxococcales bacterium]